MKLNDLITSETKIQEPTYNGDIGFDVIAAVDNEKKATKENDKQNLAKFLQQRSVLRKAIRSWDKTTWNKENDKKTVNTSSLADMFTEVMVWMGKDPKYMQETYWSSKWNIDLINKMKTIQWGKFSWDIQNYIDGKNEDLTWLVNNMFPEYMNKKNIKLTEMTGDNTKNVDIKNDTQKKTLVWDERSAWDTMAEKASQFRWSDIWLASENRPLEWPINFVAWAYNDIRRLWAGIWSLINRVAMEKPEDFNKKIDEWQFSWDYDYDKSQWYTWSYEQRKEDTKQAYADKYNRETNKTQEYEASKWDKWTNVVDEESDRFKAGELGSEIWQQVLLDKRLTNLVKYWYWAYKTYKTTKWVKDVAKWTELATKWTDLAIPEKPVNQETLNESKNVANNIIDRFNKWWTKQDLTKSAIEWGKSWLEYQLIWDVKEWKLSDAQMYWISAWLWVVLWTLFGALNRWAKWVTEPKQQLQTSLQRLWWKDTSQILDWAEASSKDGTLPSALQKTTDMAVKEAEWNVLSNMRSVWKDLWNFRKNLWWADLKLEDDFISPINNSLTKKWVWAQIVEKDWKYVVEWHPWEYTDMMNKIAERLNSLKTNVKNKMELAAAWEEVDFLSDVWMVEDLYTDLKHFSMREPNAEVKQRFIEIENDILDRIKRWMSDKDFATYKNYLDKYASSKQTYNKIWELEWKMNSKSAFTQPKMSDWQYLSDFLKELQGNNLISNNAADRRIAAIYADAFFWWYVKDSDKLIYPSVPWFLEKWMEIVVRLARNPRSKFTWWWGKFTNDYKASPLKKAAQKWLEQTQTTIIWRSARETPEE